MTERNHGAFPREYRCGGNGDFIYLCQTAEMPGGASQNATHLPAPFVGTYNYGCVSGMERRIQLEAAVRQRYNTLDFASKVVCQQGCCSLLLETQRRRVFRNGSPFCLPGGGYLYGKNRWKSHSRQRERWEDWPWWMGTEHGRRSQKATCTCNYGLKNVDCAISMYFPL